ncbi:BatA and WFA domain-containing protein [Candidatus Woesearchaeota archaeon]|nr:BatA and WFA domain-containing protein [Candidatus Woesearchaeota archaeon]
MPFANTLGLLALASLIPFIILYLRRPKPQDRIIPSLMFILQNRKTSKQYDFLRKFLTNLLFFIQLLILIGLSFAVAEPFMRIQYDVSLENTVVVLDASASMQAKEGNVMRFDEAVKEAKKALSGKNSIILAENVPLVVLEDEDSETAGSVLDTLQPKATTTNLGDAILLAKDLLQDRPGRIAVVSDFNSVDGPDLLAVKKAISSEEVVVNFEDVSNNAENAGITEMDVGKHSIKAFVKNFNSVKKQVNLKLVKDGEVIAESGKIDVLPNSVESFMFDDTPAGVSKIELEPKDDLDVDNVAYISAPLKKKVSVLLITNKHNTNLENALLASQDIGLNVVNPPVLTLNTHGEKIEPFEHEVIIVHRINNVGQRDGILPGTFQDLSNYVEKGGELIITAQDDLDKFNKADLDIVDLNSFTEDTKRICTDVVNEITKQFENDICFSTVSKYFDADARKETKVIASAEGAPIFALKEHFKGKIFYYGIIDEASDFRTLPSYPVFWNSLINFMAETEDIRDFNIKTGRVVMIDEQRVSMPSSSLRTSKVLFDEAGIYEFNDRKFAANLLDEKESEVTMESALEEESEGAEVLKEEATERNFSLSAFILLAVFLLMCFEVFYIKRRGDL